MKIYMIIVLFFLIGAFFIISNENLALSKKQNLQKFGELYVNWIDQLLANAKYVSGYVVKMDWLPKNITQAPAEN